MHPLIAARGPAERGRWAPARNVQEAQSSLEVNGFGARNAAIAPHRNRHEAERRIAVVARWCGAAEYVT
jgi:hypothetical protein